MRAGVMEAEDGADVSRRRGGGGEAEAGTEVGANDRSDFASLVSKLGLEARVDVGRGGRWVNRREV
jgi:hypothetical protein